MGARTVDYWADLTETPNEGPFILCGGPVGAEVGRIEHARGPEGVGCPVTLRPVMYRYMEDNGISRGYRGACRLNELYRKGAFVWDGVGLVPVS